MATIVPGKKSCLEFHKDLSGSILESKGMGAIFYKKGQEILKKGKFFENFEIRQVIVCYNRTQESARIGSVNT